MDISRSFKGLQDIQMGLSKGQWIMQGKVAKGYVQKEGIDYNKIFSCSQAYIYSDVINDSCSVWSRVRADGCQNNISTQWARGEDIHVTT